MDIAKQMVELAASVKSKYGIREVCLTLNSDGTWTVLAGGHPHVHIGEYGGDFDGSGATPEIALAACMHNASG